MGNNFNPKTGLKKSKLTKKAGLECSDEVALLLTLIPYPQARHLNTPLCN